MNNNSNKPEILIIDDEPESIALLKYTLSTAGYDYRAASSGEEALRAAQEKIPDLILLDLMLPDLDGYEVCARLRDDAETQHIPIIILTAYGLEASSKAKGLRSGANDYLTKPIDHDELLARIETQLRLKELEKQRILAEKLITINQIVVTLQHEITNPLTGVMGYSDVLLARMREQELAQAEIEEALKVIRAGGERIKNVMEKLRTITHPVVSEYFSGTTMIDLDNSA